VDRVESCGAVAIDRAVSAAAARYDPDPQAIAEEEANTSWNVRLHHPHGVGAAGYAATSHLEATGDTLALQKLYDLVCATATHLATLGDPDPLGARKAKALGVIADGQTLLDPPAPRPVAARTRLYLHLDGTDLLDPPAPLETTVTGGGVGVAERLGPATITKIKQWLGDTQATIVPVLHLDRDHPDADRAVQGHDPPAWMRELVTLRDPHCVFPWCARDARTCDLDHIDPYLPPDHPPDHRGPPGQTRPSNLAPLCRRHHRAKTSRRWRYRRHSDGTYTWHGPHGARYLVTPFGTTALTHA
jgi:hypothetical protein